MKETIRQAYNLLAKQYNALIDHKPHNAYYDRPNVLKLIGSCEEKVILDAACGPGKYAEELMRKGAEVVGFDISSEMIKYAKERNKEKGEFFVHDMEQHLVQIKDNTFDVIVCALALHYVQDWSQTIQEFYRLLKEGGKLVISIEHPFYEFNYFKSKAYFDVEPVKCTWNGFGVPTEMHSFRRSLGDCIAPIVSNGFFIDQLIEPKPVDEFELHDPAYFAKLNQFPAFLCISAVRR
ncbi:class I SAM-dependent methyltransferase [Ekhidna sp.]